MRRTLLALAAAALLAACGGNGGSDQASGATQTSMAHGAMSSTTQPPAAARTVRVTANDRLRFRPAALSVKAGETVAFTVTNSGKLAHEFVVGDQASRTGTSRRWPA